MKICSAVSRLQAMASKRMTDVVLSVGTSIHSSRDATCSLVCDSTRQLSCGMPDDVAHEVSRGREREIKRKECGREPRAVLGHSCARISKRSFFLEILADDRV